MLLAFVFKGPLFEHRGRNIRPLATGAFFARKVSEEFEHTCLEQEEGKD
jgi:hypothetical protein